MNFIGSNQFIKEKYFKYFILVFLCLFLPMHVYTDNFKSSEEMLTGKPRVTDGDSLRIGKTRIRLHGIDAPERIQTCGLQETKWRCGWESTNALANLITNHWVTCFTKDIDRYGRVVAVCRVGSVNINLYMVQNGWALAYRRYSSDYIEAEKIAQKQKKGIWRSQFTAPWEWRKKKKNIN